LFTNIGFIPKLCKRGERLEYGTSSSHVQTNQCHLSSKETNFSCISAAKLHWHNMGNVTIVPLTVSENKWIHLCNHKKINSKGLTYWKRQLSSVQNPKTDFSELTQTVPWALLELTLWQCLCVNIGSLWTTNKLSCSEDLLVQWWNKLSLQIPSGELHFDS
jgi:hypothetical protein